MRSLRRHLPTALVATVFGLLASVVGTAVASHSFPDVSDASPFHDQVANFTAAGCATGFPDGTYRPTDPVNRQQMAAFINRCGGRVANNESSATNRTAGTEGTAATVQMKAGAVSGLHGFVVLIGELGVSTPSAQLSTCPCQYEAQIRDGASTVFANNASDIGNVANSNAIARDSTTVVGVDLISPNEQATYRLIGQNDDNNNGDMDFSGELTAIYVPFGWDGGDSLGP